MSDSTQSTKPTRRDFLATGAAATSALAGFYVGGPAFGQNYDPIRVGVIGCGGRGRGATDNVLNSAPNVEIVSLGDVSQASIDKLNGYFTDPRQRRGRPKPQGFKVTQDRCFVGLDAYKQVIDSDVNYVILATPPGFRPEHFEYAVKAGKNIFCEKPVATDPVGIRRMLEAGRLAGQKGLGIGVGTQRHHQNSYIEAMKRIHGGAIGEVMSAHVYWNTRNIWYRERQPGMSIQDFWFYNWYHVDWLCGDHIVEQHLHNLDVANWVMNDHPIKAYGMGGRQYHTDRGGNIYDHFCVEYEYPNGVRVTSMCRQINDTDTKVAEDIIGTRGKALLVNNEPCKIVGANPWQSDPAERRIEYVQEHTDLIASIRGGNPYNKTREVTESTMMAIMGRESAYTGKVVTWDEMMASTLNLAPADVKTWDGSLRPVPKPGMPRE